MRTFHVSLEAVIHLVVILVIHCARNYQLAVVSLQWLLIDSVVQILQNMMTEDVRIVDVLSLREIL